MSKIHTISSWFEEAKYTSFEQEDYHRTPPAISMQTQDVQTVLKYFIGFGKLIGVIPVKAFGLRWCTGLLIPALLLTHTTVDLIGWAKRPIANRSISAFNLCIKVASAQFYGIGAFFVIYMHLSYSKLHEVFSRLNKLPVDIPDVSLRKFSILVPGLVMTSAILENVCFHFKMFPVFDPPDEVTEGRKTSFQVYYERHHNNWALTVPFHPVLGCLLILANKFALYAWNFADLLVVVMSRTLSFRFSSLYTKLESGKLSWEDLPHRYAQLMEILYLLEGLLSPLVLFCYYINLYATCMQLHSWMTPSENMHGLHTLYNLWSFVHLIVRVFLVSYYAAELQSQVLRYQIVVQNCPGQFYNKQISRQIRYPASVDRRGNGISGSGCFVISKPLMLKFASVAFYFEVFLLTSDRVQCE